MINKIFYEKYKRLLQTVVIMQDQDSPFLDGPYAILSVGKVENIEELRKDLKDIDYNLGCFYGGCVAFDSEDINEIGLDINDIVKYSGSDSINSVNFIQDQTEMYEKDDKENIDNRIKYLGYNKSLSDFLFIKEGILASICELK